MTTKWEDPEYQVLVTGGPLGTPANYKFKMQPTVTTPDGKYYSVVLSSGASSPANPLTGIILLPQLGKPLIHYLPKSKRLDPMATTYKDDVAALLDEIICSKIDADPDSFERLVGVVPIPPQLVNVITLYKVDNTHKNGEALIVVLLRTIGAAPGGSIGIIGR